MGVSGQLEAPPAPSSENNSVPTVFNGTLGETQSRSGRFEEEKHFRVSSNFHHIKQQNV
jgi:hypothetical protein